MAIFKKVYIRYHAPSFLTWTFFLKKIPVGILGATGMVGQQYLQILATHPWFEIAFMASSNQSAGKSYGETVQNRWYQSQPLPENLAKMPLNSIDDLMTCKESCRLVFSALSSEAAKIYEEKYALAGLPVVSNASYHRHSADVPVLIPEINAEHLKILSHQRKNRNWTQGFIVVKPNCSIQSYMIPLEALHKKFQLKKIFATTMQSISGAGYPGVSSYHIQDNIIPFIEGEEEKSETEPLKIWGKIVDNKIVAAQDISLSVHCNRVPVLDGHMACVSMEFASKPTLADIFEAWDSFESLPKQLALPSAPEHAMIYQADENRPQPRLDRMAGKGMSITVGRLRSCPLLHYRFVALSHNTIRGAAGGGILNAELLYQLNYLI